MQSQLPTFCRAAVIMLTVCFIGCSNDSGPPVQTVTSDAVHLQLNWMPDLQHGGFYAAELSTYFIEQDLVVSIDPGGPGSKGLEKLAMDQVEFAVANADQVLMARQNGADVVAIFAAFQQSPRCILVHDESEVRSFEDLNKVKTLAMQEGRGFSKHLKQKYSLTGPKIVNYSGTVAQFVTDKTYAQQGYIFTEPGLAEDCLLYTSPSPRDATLSRMPSSA